MTREEAIRCLYVHSSTNGSGLCTDKQHYEAKQMAIKALEQEPCREADDYENEISDLYNHLDIVEYDKERLREEVTTLEEKLKGLSAEPCEDAISIESAIHCLEQLVTDMPQLKLYAQKVADAMSDLPHVYPKPKTGHWINKSQRSGCGVLFVASECTCCEKKTLFNCNEFLYNFCPNCGAKMVEPQESEG